jgi:hypothetical protein
MGRKPIEIDKDRVVELYAKFGTINRTVLSAGCSAAKVKEILIERGVEIKPYIPKRFNINSIKTW